MPGGAIFPVRIGRNTIGSRPDSDICLNADPQVSGEHAVLLCRGGKFHLADRLSTNGTFLNGEEVDVTNPVPIKDRDRLRFGATECVFLALPVEADGAEEPPAGETL